MEVTVSLKNPPSGATEWQLIIFDWNKTQIDSKMYIPITDPAVFEFPPGTLFPLRVDILMYHNGIIDYRMQSVEPVFPFLPEFYVEAFIPDYGNYYYNVATEQFEGIAPPVIEITAPDSAEEGATVPVSVKVTNTRDIGYIFKIEIFAVPDAYPSYLIFSTEDLISGGYSKNYSTSFTMPDCDTTILVWVERWDVDHWTYFGSASKIVSFLAILYKGTIIRKELKYDETRDIIPVY